MPNLKPISSPTARALLLPIFVHVHVHNTRNFVFKRYVALTSVLSQKT